ncbi:MAG TPA: hypothetical protein VMY36_00005 [Patescibacteria group bacterium]|nr:hypothetical protein [Patescibacteria group bacterium]
MSKKEPEEKAIVKYGPDRLAENAGVGIKGVDPADIRPPQILLTQALSDPDDFKDKEGKQAEVGQFFHTGQFKIYDSFECYFLFAAKSKYIDKRKPKEGEKDQYKVLGCLVDDISLFGMTFKASSLFALSKLFSSVISGKRPMYSFRCKIETKMVSGEKGDYFVPVLRSLWPEDDPEKLIFLEDMAKSFDARGPEAVEEEEEEIKSESEREEPTPF